MNNIKEEGEGEKEQQQVTQKNKTTN